MMLRKYLIIACVLIIAVGLASVWNWFAPSPTPPEQKAALERPVRETEAEPAQRELQPPPQPGTQTSPTPVPPPLETGPPKPTAPEPSASPSKPRLAPKPQHIAKRLSPPKIPEVLVPQPPEPQAKESRIVQEASRRPTSSVSKRPKAPRKLKKPQLMGKAPPREHKKEIKPAAKAEAKYRKAPVSVRPSQPGLYETIRVATARSAPSDSAAVVDRIRPGKILNVTGSEGDWLLVHSKRRNITVYVRRDEAMYMVNQKRWGASLNIAESRWKDIEREIQRALTKRGVTGVSVSFIGDTAYLRGTVKTQMKRDRAEMAAHSIPEVKHIFNGVRVDRTWDFKGAEVEKEFDQAEEYLED